MVLPYDFPPPPPGLNYLGAIEPSFTFVLISLPLSSILVPILLLILFFSTSTSRRTLLFALNILIVLLGIIEGVLSTFVQSITILRPHHLVSDQLFLTYLTLAFCTPILVDCVLILRLGAVYPANITRRATRLAILAVPLLCTAIRIGCVSIVVRRWALRSHHTTALLAGTVIWPQNSMIIADWSIQLFENMYCSSLFLLRLRDHKTFSPRMYHNQSIPARIRAVFYIALSNFVFPSILSVVQFVYIIHDPSIVHGAIVLMVNNYVSIIGVVFSTLWCSSDIWKGSHNADHLGAAFPQSIITLSGIAPNLISEPRSRSHSQPHPAHNRLSQTYNDSDLKDSDSSADIPQGRYMQALALGRTRDAHPDADADSASETPSRSPITPHGGNDAHGDADVHAKRWGAGDSDDDDDIELEFAAPTPPPVRSWHRHRRRSLDSPDVACPWDAAGRMAQHPQSVPAPRASFLDWSDSGGRGGGGGGRTPSWDGCCSLAEP